MITGRDNLQLINQHLQQAQTAQEEAGKHLGELHRQLNALHQETGERYRELARLRLDSLQASQLVSRLDETDQATLKLLENLKQARHALQERINASITRKEQLEEQRKELERRRDDAGEDVQRQLEQTRRMILETDAYRQQQKRAQEAAAVGKHADEKASQTEKDQQEKGKPYEADSLFMYLWQRRYLTPDYQAGWFGRRLDNWVAKHIDFQRNRSNYHMLQELPRRLREHATKAQQTARLEAQALQTLERQAAEADGLLDLQTRVRDAEKQLNHHDAQIEAEEARHRQLLQEQAGFNEATDPLSKQVIDLQMAALQREELSELLRKARATPRPEDDVVVTRLQQIQQQQTQIAGQIQSINQFLQQQQRNMAELEELRRRYRQNGYDAYNSSFPADFALGSLLGQLLGGLINSDMIWQELGRNHQSRQPSSDRGGFGGGFGGGPGDEGSGFGGGGFRTGGGF
jgi:chromosome segregation ATPase